MSVSAKAAKEIQKLIEQMLQKNSRERVYTVGWAKSKTHYSTSALSWAFRKLIDEGVLEKGEKNTYVVTDEFANMVLPIEERAEAQAYIEEKSEEYQDRLAAKEQRWEVMAEKKRQESKQYYDASNNAIRGIPPGQPILVGHHSEKRHRNALERSHNAMRKSIEAEKKAQHYESKQLTTAIMSDDPEAIKQIKFKLDNLRRHQKFMKTVNQIWRSHKKPYHDDKDQTRYQAFTKEMFERYPVSAAEILLAFRRDFMKRAPYSYHLTNNNANIKRLEKRLAQERAKLEATIEVGNEELTFGEIEVVINREDNRVQILFPGKPDADTRQTLKRNGFRWSPRNAAWQRHITDYAIQLAKRLAGEFSQQ